MITLTWQKIIEESLFSEADLYWIAVESSYFTSAIASSSQFAHAGQKFLDLAQEIDHSSERWLQNWLNTSYGESDCVVPHDWSDWLDERTQQYVSVAFLDKYAEIQEPNNYPQERQERVSWSTSIVEDLVPDLEAVLSVSHTEEIELWCNLVTGYLQSCDRLISFSELTEYLTLSPAEIYLGVLLGENLHIIPDEDFYGGFLVKCR